MKRLTQKQSAGYELKALDGEWCNHYCHKQRIETCNECGIYEAIQRLAYYEDLKEQERLVELPCKIGARVYYVYADDCGGLPCSGDCWNCIYAYWKIKETKFKLKMVDDFGISVFNVYEEAEKALEKFKERVK